MFEFLIPLAVFGGVAALVGAVFFVLRDLGPTATEDRLEILTGRKSPEAESKGILKEDSVRDRFAPFAKAFGKLAQRVGNFGRLFEQADSPIKPEAFVGITFGCALLGVAAACVANSPVPLYPVAGLTTGLMPLMWLLWRRRSRFKKFAKQLPDALELIGRALRSGHSLASGLSVVVDEMPSPVSDEFGMAFEQQNLGVPIENALKNMLIRIPNLDLKFFVTAVAIQRQSGGDLAEILDKISHIIRERFKILGLVQALTGEGRISGVVLMLLPVALFAVVYHLNREYVELLFTDPLGRKMLIAALVLQLLGAIVIKKIVDIKI